MAEGLTHNKKKKKQRTPVGQGTSESAKGETGQGHRPTYATGDGSGTAFKHDHYSGGPRFQPGLCGLRDPDNHTYRNSVLQCLSNVPMLTKYFINDEYRCELNYDNPLGMNGVLAISYAGVMESLWSGGRKGTGLQDFLIQLDRFAPQFQVGSGPGDAQEMLVFLLDGLHEDLNKITKRPNIDRKDSDGRPDEIIAKETWEDHLKRNNSIIVDLFHGQFKTKSVCQDEKCGKVVLKFDPFCFLSVPLSSQTCRKTEVTLLEDFAQGGSISLQECLKHFLRYGTFDEQMESWCPTCRALREVSTSFALWILPKVLLIHFKRTVVSRRRRVKLDTFITYPISGLDLADFVTGPRGDHGYAYDLVAVINHHGGPEGGYNTAYAKNAPTDKWYRFCGLSVSPIPEGHVVSKDAFVLFYVRQDCLEDFKQNGLADLVKLKE